MHGDDFLGSWKQHNTLTDSRIEILYIYIQSFINPTQARGYLVFAVSCGRIIGRQYSGNNKHSSSAHTHPTYAYTHGT